MKRIFLLPLLFLILTASAQPQSFMYPRFVSPDRIADNAPAWMQPSVEIKFDTTVLFEGVPKLDGKKCFAHEFVFAQRRYKFAAFRCDVMHGPIGCPDTWQNDTAICTICLRHLHIVETRTYRVPEDPYKKALERLNFLLSKKDEQ